MNRKTRPMELLPKEAWKEINEVIEDSKNSKRAVARGIAFREDVIEWLNTNRGEANLSDFVNRLLEIVIKYYKVKKT